MSDLQSKMYRYLAKSWVRRATPKPYRGTLQFALLTHAWVRRAFSVRGLGGHLTPVTLSVIGRRKQNKWI